MSAGLQYASGVNDGTLLALLQIDGWRMIAPVVHGDTIRMITRILEKKESSKPDRGVVTLKRTIVNQRNETVQEMQAKLLYRRRVQ
jgi:acyl dehydratase